MSWSIMAKNGLTELKVNTREWQRAIERGCARQRADVGTRTMEVLAAEAKHRGSRPAALGGWAGRKGLQGWKMFLRAVCARELHGPS